MEHDLFDSRLTGDPPDFDVEHSIPKRYRYRCDPIRSGQLVKYAVGWRSDTHSPALAGQRTRQVTHDIADAADFAAWQRSVL